jgi:hypothetical protein
MMRPTIDDPVLRWWVLGLWLVTVAAMPEAVRHLLVGDILAGWTPFVFWCTWHYVMEIVDERRHRAWMRARR